jgi:hypothetical protein
VRLEHATKADGGFDCSQFSSDVRVRPQHLAAVILTAERKLTCGGVATLPWELQLLKRTEREEVVRLRARILRARIGPCEHMLRRIGRWMDGTWGKFK